jgi:peptidoglycan hydrolase-like protein with peptidoglycan-binding domain
LAAADTSVLINSGDLKLGSTGAAVKVLQQYLNENGYTVAPSGVGSKGKETSTFGNATAAALAKFQEANGVSATGYFGAKTRALIANLVSNSSTNTTTTSSTTIASYEAQITTLKALLATLQQRLASCNTTTTTSTNDTTAPYITGISIVNGGDSGSIDVGDAISITFSESINPDSINSELDEGDTVKNVSSTSEGGLSVSSSGVITVNKIVTFDMGSVESSGTFISKIALSSNGRVLTSTITSGDDVDILSESFSNTTQISGTVEDNNGNAMGSTTLAVPSGSFGGESTNDDFAISSIKVYDGGDEGYVDVNDYIVITFSNPIDPDTVDESLSKGGTVTGVAYSDIGGVKISSAGKVTIYGIATFDMGDVEDSGTFTSKIAISSSGKVLTITLTSGSDVEIEEENFTDPIQVSGNIEDDDGIELSDDDIEKISGTFGGDSDNSSSDTLSISSIKAYDGGDEGKIDDNDYVVITFSKEIDPDSISSSLNKGSTLYGVAYSETGGVSVSTSGIMTIRGITTFDIGDVQESGTFTSKLALSSSGKVLTITFTSGSNDITISDEDFDNATQIGNFIKDEDNVYMASDSSISDPTGTFGGEDD